MDNEDESLLFLMGELANAVKSDLRGKGKGLPANRKVYSSMKKSERVPPPGNAERVFRTPKPPEPIYQPAVGFHPAVDSDPAVGHAPKSRPQPSVYANGTLVYGDPPKVPDHQGVVNDFAAANHAMPPVPDTSTEVISSLIQNGEVAKQKITALEQFKEQGMEAATHEFDNIADKHARLTRRVYGLESSRTSATLLKAFAFLGGSFLLVAVVTVGSILLLAWAEAYFGVPVFTRIVGPK